MIFLKQFKQLFEVLDLVKRAGRLIGDIVLAYAIADRRKYL